MSFKGSITFASTISSFPSSFCFLAFSSASLASLSNLSTSSKYISTGKKEQYLFIIPLTVNSSKNSLLSSSINSVIVVPLSFLASDSDISYSVPPSDIHLTGVAPSVYESVSICTF